MKLHLRVGFAALALGVACLVLGTSGRAGDKEAKVKVGDKVATFESVDDQGKPWKAKDVIGKKTLVLYFYPADFTGGCTAQACGFRDEIEKLHGQGIEVVGVSGDTPTTHKLFKNHHKLSFTLLADERGELAKFFGVPASAGGTVKNAGVDADGKKIDITRGSTIQRFTVVITKDGTVAAIDGVKNAGGDAKRISELVKKVEKN
ncbi:MAG: peroxiredoxin [Planctomycetes bacterium]|nr:peroxiredoxin [Planctomycetota bacterium]